MDKFEQIAATAQHTVGIVGNKATKDYVFLPLAESLTEETMRTGQSRGWEFLGVAGIVNGVLKVALEEPLDEAATAALALAFFHSTPKDDSVDWLERLYRLEDPR